MVDNVDTCAQNQISETKFHARASGAEAPWVRKSVTPSSKNNVRTCPAWNTSPRDPVQSIWFMTVMNWTWYFYLLTHGFGTIDSTWFISADLKELPMCCKLRFHSLRQQTMPTFNEFNIVLICQVLSCSAIEEKSWRKAASRCLLNFAKALQRCHKWPWQEIISDFCKTLDVRWAGQT